MTESRQPDAPHDELSVVLGGPVYQALCRVRLLEPPLKKVARRIAFVVLLVWLPLMVLSLLEGTALPGNVGLPFLHDVAANVRFLVAAPLFVYAELPVHERTRHILLTFRERGLIGPELLERFRSRVAFVVRMRNSLVVELGMLVLVFTLGPKAATSSAGLDPSNWCTQSGGGLTSAGWWFAHVSLPVVQFLLLRWLYRLLLWSYLMWRISRLDLRLIPTHPDRSGGLGFLGEVTTVFAPLLFAMSSLVAGIGANQILQGQETLLSLKVEIGSFVGFVLVLVLTPLCFFAPRIAAAKRKGKVEYGALAARYTREFDDKWVRSAEPPTEPLLGNADVQSLADLAGSYEIVAGMRPVPFGLDVILAIVLPVLAPLAPLVLSVVPLDELLKRVFELLF
ncbi:MAG: hypothetical protein HZA53_15690 [Planctomycetes bacterium]|nr:hypothetical protein [Planctomycetota bacterium]